ncbi:hypothetical protein KS4_16230 [Poriferisphaera corsica]|uniref:Uncharacterized protein n=1 Tax=Poriferisphaera corsica TaxID=2528020 RepID=A0A517YTR6_9BACT|nr:hypothetical protein [Poriferisphaera corsica]QDU33572.1 hypothetical protein KS4_16230 [Poriferisphaera corsica]
MTDRVLAITSDYLVKKTLLGKKVVEYVCGHCGAELVSSLDEAGMLDRCPICRGAFHVPGDAVKAGEELRKQQKIDCEKEAANKRLSQARKQAFRQREQRKIQVAAVLAQHQEFEKLSQYVPSYWAMKAVGTLCIVLGYCTLALYVVFLVCVVMFSMLGAIQEYYAISVVEVAMILGGSTAIVITQFIIAIALGNALHCLRDMAQNSYRLLKK